MTRPFANQRDFLPAILFIMPNFLGFIIFTAGPVLVSLVAAFSNWDLLGTVPFAWVGFDNFTTLLADKKFWLYLVNTLYLMAGIPFAIAGSLALALLLNDKIRGVIVFRTLYYLPTFTAGIALMVLWKSLYNPEYGPINQALEWIATALGADSYTAPRWLQSTLNLVGLEVESVGIQASQFGLGARDALNLMGIWTGIGGNGMLLFIAALQNVPTDLYEAADIDGANQWQKFLHVTFPQIAPTTFFIVIMSIIGGLQGGFEQARVMTGGGPANSTKTLAYYIYEEAFMDFQIGYASTIAWVLFIIIFGATLSYWKFGNQSQND